MSDCDIQIARCKERIAGLTLRVVTLKESLPETGLGAESTACLIPIEQTLDSWRQRLTTLNGARAEILAHTRNS